MRPRQKATLACLLSIATGSIWHAEAGAFPLAITVMMASGATPQKLAWLFGSHLLAILAAGLVIAARAELATAIPTGLGPPLTPLSWLIGCSLLFTLQTGRLRHLPALASGGAVLAGLSPLAIVCQTVVTATLLLLARDSQPTHLPPP